MARWIRGLVSAFAGWTLVAVLLAYPAERANAVVWMGAASMADARSEHTATLLPSGKVLVVGGRGAGNGAPLATAEIYDPDRNAWTSAGSLANARASHTATLLPSGKVLVVGGLGGNGYLASAQLYDPVLNSWSDAGQLAVARAQNTATLLASGRVLVVGGAGNAGPSDVVELYDPATNAWTSAANLGTPRYNHAAALLPTGEVLVSGGYDMLSNMRADSEIYDPADNTWHVGGALNGPREAHTATLLPSGKLLVADGSTNPRSAELYDPLDATWSPVGSLAHQRVYHSATLLPSGAVLVVGGTPGFPNFESSAELYDPTSQAWSSAGALAIGRRSHTATLLPSGRVLIAGGYNQNGYLASVEIYEPAIDTWAAAGSMVGRHGNQHALLLPSGKVLEVAGSANGFAQWGAEIYDPASNTWSAAGHLATARVSSTATLLGSGEVLVAGGYDGHTYFASAERYDPATQLASPAGSLATAREYHTATLLPSGKVLVTGGFNGAAYFDSAEIFDPSTNTWSATGSLAARRGIHTATLLPSGKVLVAGGFNGTVAVAAAELFDPDSGTWSSAGTLATGRYFHTATLLPSGKVLVACGRSPGYQASAELYDPVTNAWTPAGSLATFRYVHTATLLSSGEVLVAGGENNNPLASAEIYQPSTNSWRSAGNLSVPRYAHSATLLPSGDVLVAGGANFAANVGLQTTERYRGDRGIADARRPVVTTTTAPIAAGDQLDLVGSGFTGDSEASGGGANSSATNAPLVQLRRLDNEQVVWTAPAFDAVRSSTAYRSAALPDIAGGYYALTLLVNALPSVSRVINVIPSFTVTSSSIGGGAITPNAVQTVARGETREFVLAPDPNHHLDNVAGTCGGTLAGMSFTTVPIVADCSVVAQFSIDTVRLIYASGAHGAISGLSPQTVPYGADGLAVAAIPDNGYHFVRWSDGSTTNPRIDTHVVADINVTATFALDTHTLVYASGIGGAIDGASPQVVDYDADGSSVTAVPDVGHHFVQWSDGSTTNPRTDTHVVADINVTAAFALETHTLVYTAGIGGAIDGTSPQIVDYDANGSPVTPVPDIGHHFVQWSDGSTANPRADTHVVADLAVSASFAIDLHMVTAVAGANGTITPATQSAAYGEMAQFTVVADAGYAATLSGDACEVSGNGNSWTAGPITADCTVTASFTLIPLPALAISVTDHHDHVAYGSVHTYVVTVSNTGAADAIGVALSNDMPPQLDTLHASWVCEGAGAGAVCAAKGSGALDTGDIVIPVGRTLTWRLTAPVLQDAGGDTVDFAVGADIGGGSNVAAADVDTLVIFRNGLDNGDGD